MARIVRELVHAGLRASGSVARDMFRSVSVYGLGSFDGGDRSFQRWSCLISLGGLAAGHNVGVFDFLCFEVSSKYFQKHFCGTHAIAHGAFDSANVWEHGTAMVAYKGIALDALYRGFPLSASLAVPHGRPSFAIDEKSIVTKTNSYHLSLAGKTTAFPTAARYRVVTRSASCSVATATVLSISGHNKVSARA